ncbi:MAG: hypothetical protein AABW80_02560 [Nanoarchaeota archaeon]
MNGELRLNEWISSPHLNFKYELYWPYVASVLNPDSDSVDVYCQLNGRAGRSIGTFITYGKIGEMMARFKQTGENERLFVPMGRELIVDRISNDVVEGSIVILLRDNLFDEHFKPIVPS